MRGDARVMGTSVIPTLGRWGLTPDADLIYRTLRLLGPDTTPQLAREVGLSAARVGAAVDELVAAGAACQSAEGGDRRWVALDGPRVLGVLGRRRGPMEMADRHRRHLAAVAGVHLDRLPPGAVRRLPSRSAARARIADLAACERVEHLAINTEQVISAEAARAAAPLDQALLARGVRMRNLGIPPAAGRVLTPAPGVEHRESEALPLKLMVFDRRAALFPADPADFNAGAVEVTDPDAVARLTELFHTIWYSARDPRRQEVPTIVLTHRERAIVELLAAGESEEAVAIALGLSRRTVVYTVRSLMDRIGVENRFQLALCLGAAQAVPLPPSFRPCRPDSQEDS
jgi:DNA-binding CsgD family transcriptional regulator